MLTNPTPHPRTPPIRRAALAASAALAALFALPLARAAEPPPSTPATMKAVRIHAHGTSDDLRYEDAPVPTPGRGEVLIRVHAAAVNPVDWKILRGGFRDLSDRMPYTTGFDVAGVIESVGEGATRLKPGDSVFAYQELMRGGGYAEFMVIKEEHVAPKPKNLGFVEAAAVPLAALTAYQALYEKAELQPGQTVLIHGAAGGVGSFAVQLAKARGARVIGTASAGNHEFLRSIGADETVDYRAVRFEDVVTGVDVVLDCVGGDTLDRSYGVLKKGGRLVTIAGQPSPEKAEQHGVLAQWMLVYATGQQLGKIGEMIERGEVRPIVTQVLPLAEARRAHELSQTGRTRGKIVLTVRDERPTPASPPTSPAPPAATPASSPRSPR